MPPALIDTNVLVYAHDRGEHSKQARALSLLDVLQRTQTGRLSAQCLAEFFRATTRQPAPMLTGEQAARQIERLSRAWPVFSISRMIVLEAVRGTQAHQLAYWDAQIWAAARLNQVPLVLSEDFSDGLVLEGVRFLNPFAPAFDPQAWA